MKCCCADLAPHVCAPHYHGLMFYVRWGCWLWCCKLPTYKMHTAPPCVNYWLYAALRDSQGVKEHDENNELANVKCGSKKGLSRSRPFPSVTTVCKHALHGSGAIGELELLTRCCHQANQVYPWKRKIMTAVLSFLITSALCCISLLS